MMLIVGAAGVYVLVLLRYACRECGRQTERGLHVVSSAEGESLVAGFLESGFADGVASDLLHQQSAAGGRRFVRGARQQGAVGGGARRERLYMPPLPRSVIRRMQTIDANGGKPRRGGAPAVHSARDLV